MASNDSNKTLLPQREPYKGSHRRLVIAFDVGTTFSGVSYAVLDPGQLPVIHGVTQFPGQQKVGGDSKIPSIVCYDDQGNLVGTGSEAFEENNPELMEVEGLQRAEWFKLRLRPKHLPSSQEIEEKLPPLPKNKTASQVFSDLLAYLFQSTKQYIQQRHGTTFWSTLDGNIDFVLGHPNGWEGEQQSEMRKAVIAAGLVSGEKEAQERVTFVSEGEASLHFCLRNIIQGFEPPVDTGMMVIDCGGGTVDISTYTRVSNSSFKEIAPPQCLVQGSVLVTQRAREYLSEKLKGSAYGNAIDIKNMTDYFDQKTKVTYNGSQKMHFIKFGRGSDNDAQYGVQCGSIKVPGSDIARFFEPSIQEIIKVISEQSHGANVKVSMLYLVGGFATSDYLFSRLEEHFKDKGFGICRPDAYLNKVVADGAVSFILDHYVKTRVSKYSYGVECRITYLPSLPDHAIRAHTIVQNLEGIWRVPNVFDIILKKNTEISEETEFKRSYHRLFSPDEFKMSDQITSKILHYRGRAATPPTWMDLEPDSFPRLCSISADITQLKKGLVVQRTRQGKQYYEVKYDVVLLFGLTELKAQITWKEKGVEKRGHASVVYESEIVVGD